MMKNIANIKRVLVVAMMLMVWITAVRADQTTTTAWTQLTSGSTSGYTLSSGYYYLTSSLTFSNSTAGGNGITIDNDAVVHIYIPSGVTLTATGANGSGQTGGGAGIYIPGNATLHLHGSGTVNATGGNAANGSNGSGGSNGWWSGTYWYTGQGGNGGAGGGGAGAGIGTSGGAGGSGGTGGASQSGYWGNKAEVSANRGNSGNPGNKGLDMGTLKKESSLNVSASGGNSASSGGSGGGAGSGARDHGSGWEVNYTMSGGGGGGGGGAGNSAYGIGTGGAGGGGGAGGDGGTSVWTSASGEYYCAGASGGKGGSGKLGGSNGAQSFIEGVGSRASNYCYDRLKPTGGSAGGSAGEGSSSIAYSSTSLQYQISYSGIGFSGESPVNYYVGNSTTVTLPTVEGRKWKLMTYGHLCAASTSSPFTQAQTEVYSGTVNLNDVYGDIAFETYANEHTLSATVTQLRADGTAGSGNSVSWTKNHEGNITSDSPSMVQYTDGVTLTSNVATGYYLESRTSSDVTISADNTFTMPDNDVAVSATFREKEYNVIYDATSAGMTIDGQTKYHLTDLMLSRVQPTKEGYTFLGWSRTQDATTADFAPGSMADDDLNGTNHGDNVSLFAVWRANDYKVIIDPSICGGAVTANGSAKAGDDVYLTIEMDEGYTGLNELYYTVEGSTGHVVIDQGTKKFQMPAGNVMVFASFRGEFSLVQDPSLTQDETLTDGQLYIGKTLLGSAEVGRKVKLTVKSNDDKRLKSITYQKVTGTNVMKARTRAEASDVPIEGKITILADDPSVSYFSQQASYVATINNIDGNLRVSADFEDKIDLSAVTVALQGVSETYPAGSNPDDAGWNATVNGEAQERDVDVTISYTMSNGNNIGSKGTITVTAKPNSKNYKGSKTFDNQFTMVKTAPANYTVDGIPSAVYTGAAITPAPVVKKDGAVMEASDYTVSYSNNTNVGTATVQVKVTDDTDGECYVTQTFLITQKALTLSLTAGTKTITYGDELAGNPSEVTATTLTGGDVLSAITFSSASILTGSHELTLSGAVIKSGDGSQYRTDNYNITYTAGTLTINQKAATLTAGNMTICYGASVPADADYNVTAGGLQYSDQLTVKPTLGTDYLRGSNVGTYSITCGTNPTVKAGSTDVTSCYTFTPTNGTLTVEAFDLRDAYIVVTNNEKGYNGSAQTATVTVYTAEGGYDITSNCIIWYGDTQLGQTVALSQTARGAYPITVKPETGNINVIGQKEADESLVIGLKSIADQTGDIYDVCLTGVAKTYTGSAIEPTLADITVTYLDNDLTDDQKTVEFEITDYANNLNVGTATVSMIGRNVNFSGTRTANFPIVAAPLATQLYTASTVYAATVRAEDVSGGNVRTVTPSGNSILMPYQGEPFQLKSEDVEVWLTGGVNKLSTADYVIKYKKNGITYDNINDIGTYTVVIAAGTSGNTSGEGETTLTVETQREIVVTKNEWVTYYDGKYDVAVPEGYNAYYVKSVSGTTVTVGTLSFIPKDVPVLLHTSAYANNPSEEEVTLAVSAATGTAPTDLYANAWGVGSVTGNQHSVESYTTMAGCTDYIIVKSLFVKAEPNTTVDEHRCFLRMATSGARAVYSILVDDDTTAVFGLNGQGEMNNDRWYDLQGNRIGKPTKRGLYIRNGKKIVIK